MSTDDVETYLREQLQAAEAQLDEARSGLEPLETKVRRLRASLSEYTAGSRTSQKIGDDQIVAIVKRQGSKSSPMSATQIAAALGIDTRGISRRLPRMANEKLLSGDAHRGYWVERSRS